MEHKKEKDKNQKKSQNFITEEEHFISEASEGIINLKHSKFFKEKFQLQYLKNNILNDGVENIHYVFTQEDIRGTLETNKRVYQSVKIINQDIRYFFVSYWVFGDVLKAEDINEIIDEVEDLKEKNKSLSDDIVSLIKIRDSLSSSLLQFNLNFDVLKSEDKNLLDYTQKNKSDISKNLTKIQEIENTLAQISTHLDITDGDISNIKSKQDILIEEIQNIKNDILILKQKDTQILAKINSLNFSNQSNKDTNQVFKPIDILSSFISFAKTPQDLFSIKNMFPDVIKNSPDFVKLESDIQKSFLQKALSDLFSSLNPIDLDSIYNAKYKNNFGPGLDDIDKEYEKLKKIYKDANTLDDAFNKSDLDDKFVNQMTLTDDISIQEGGVLYSIYKAKEIFLQDDSFSNFVKNADENIIKYYSFLTSKPIYLTQRGRDVMSYIASSSNPNSDKLMQALLQKEPEYDFYKKDDASFTCMMQACIYNNIKAVSFLLSHNKQYVMQTNVFDKNAFYYAAYFGNIDIVNMLISKLFISNQEIINVINKIMFNLDVFYNSLPDETKQDTDILSAYNSRKQAVSSYKTKYTSVSSNQAAESFLLDLMDETINLDEARYIIELSCNHFPFGDSFSNQILQKCMDTYQVIKTRPDNIKLEKLKLIFENVLPLLKNIIFTISVGFENFENWIKIQNKFDQAKSISFAPPHNTITDLGDITDDFYINFLTNKSDEGQMKNLIYYTKQYNLRIIIKFFIQESYYDGLLKTFIQKDDLEKEYILNMLLYFIKNVIVVKNSISFDSLIIFLFNILIYTTNDDFYPNFKSIIINSIYISKNNKELASNYIKALVNRKNNILSNFSSININITDDKKSKMLHFIEQLEV